jgi:formylglycine-generating enzyme
MNILSLPRLWHFAAVLLFAAGVCRAAAPVVTNVRGSQAWLTQQVEIRYDLQDADSATVRVSLQVSEDGGGTWNVPATSLSGFGFGDSVAPGNDRYILWNAPADWPGHKSSLVRFRVVVNDDPIPAGMALIPAGNFQMGNAMNLGEDSRELPVHTVYVSAFYMDRYEVTKAMWDDVRAWGLTHGYTDLPVGSGKAAAHPVQSITWYALVKWCNARSEKEGLTAVYCTNDARTTLYKTGSVNVTNAQVKWSANGYRLPTEAEWEKAARGGAAGHRFPWANVETITHSQANYYSSANYSYDVSPTRDWHPTYAVGGGPYTSPVGSFAPNGYGLYDMVGNVYEWCWDWYSGTWYSQSAASANDPQGPPGSSFRVLRGGSWNHGPGDGRTSRRNGSYPAFPGLVPSSWEGFRSVRR